MSSVDENVLLTLVDAMLEAAVNITSIITGCGRDDVLSADLALEPADVCYHSKANGIDFAIWTAATFVCPSSVHWTSTASMLGRGCKAVLLGRLPSSSLPSSQISGLLHPTACTRTASACCDLLSCC